MKIDGYLNQILQRYSEGPYYDEVKRAKEEFFLRAGQVAEGSDKFETQMESFLDWYLFDRPLEKHDLCPVKLFVIQYGEKLDPEDRAIFDEISRSRHSLFELLKVKNNDVYIKDLFEGEKYIIEESEINEGFTKGDIFEGRLIPFRGRLVFGKSFVFHPRDCRSYINKSIKRIKYLDEKQRLRLIHHLASMRLKLDQYPHIDAVHIYTENPAF